MTPERKEEIEFWYRVAEKAQLIKYVHDLLAALEETQHLLQDHGPNGRNYTNQQYVGLGYQLAEEKAFREETDKELRQAQTENVKLVNELAEAQQTIARLTAALIAERDAALVWDGIGTIRRINEALGEGAEADAT